jgi:hypothetical protein
MAERERRRVELLVIRRRKTHNLTRADDGSIECETVTDLWGYTMVGERRGRTFWNDQDAEYDITDTPPTDYVRIEEAPDVFVCYDGGDGRGCVGQLHAIRELDD